MSNIIKIIILAILLTILSYIVIVISGNTYIYRVEVFDNIKNIDEVKIDLEQKKESIIIKSKKIKDGYIELKLKSHSKGDAILSIYKNEYTSMVEKFYVHNFGVITKNYYFGKSRGDIVIPISQLIFTIYLFCLLIKKYINSRNKNLYQYKNIVYLGSIIFLVVFLINLLHQLFNYNGLIDSLNVLLNLASSFSIILFPIAVVVSIFVIFSNITLIRKEGFTWKNMLGIILSLLVITSTILPSVLYKIILESKNIDIFNEKAIGTYIYNFIETSISFCLAYLESILLSTIILSIKAARRIPSFNKDFIIILGCMLRKDGTLTPLLKSRVDKAIEFSKLQKENNNKDIIFVPSGGQGKDEIIPEAEAIKNYLLNQGIKSKNILVENKSTSTYENIKFSYKLIKEKNKNPNIAFSTTNYHVFRAGNIATMQKIEIEGIGAKTKSYFWLNAFIREFVATLYIEKKKHITAICVVLLLIAIMQVMMYISNIL